MLPKPNELSSNTGVMLMRVIRGMISHKGLASPPGASSSFLSLCSFPSLFIH